MAILVTASADSCFRSEGCGRVPLPTPLPAPPPLREGVNWPVVLGGMDWTRLCASCCLVMPREGGCGLNTASCPVMHNKGYGLVDSISMDRTQMLTVKPPIKDTPEEVSLPTKDKPKVLSIESHL